MEEQQIYTLEYQCDSNVQFEAYYEIAEWEKKKWGLLNQLKQGNCLLQVNCFSKRQRLGNARDPFKISYYCNSPAKKLRYIIEDQISDEQKILYFCQLIQLAKTLKKLTIIHLNMKLDNIIWYDNKFYVINFGFLDDFPPKFVIEKNFGNEAKPKEFQRYLFPYLNHTFLSFIKDNKGNTDLIEKKIKSSNKQELLKYDQYALGIMMLELFVPLKDIYKDFEIQTCIDQAQKRSEQLKRIYNCKDNFGEDCVQKIHDIILNIIQVDKLPTDKDVQELQKCFDIHLKKKNTQIDQNNSMQLNLSMVSNESSPLIRQRQISDQIILQNKLQKENQDYVYQLMNNQIFVFDPNLLYYFTKKDLIFYCGQVNEFIKNKEENTQVKEYKTNCSKMQDELKKKIILLKTQYLQNKNYDNFSKLSKEDKYFLLKDYINGNNEINNEIEKEIQQLNQIQENEFKFNNINKSLTEQKPEIIYQEINIEQERNNYQLINNQLEISNKQKTIVLSQKLSPIIKLFMECQRILLNNGQYQSLNQDFEIQEEQIISDNKIIVVKLNRYDKSSYIIKSIKKQPTKQLYIGNISQNNQFKGNIIEEKENDQVVEYENVTCNNFFEHKKNCKNVTINTYVFVQGDFKFQSNFRGNLKDNLYDEQGIFIDLENKYSYEGQWKNGKKHGEGTIKRLDIDSQRKAQFTYLKGKFSEDYLTKVIDIQFLLCLSELKDISKKEMTKILYQCSQEENYLFKFDNPKIKIKIFQIQPL